MLHPGCCRKETGMSRSLQTKDGRKWETVVDSDECRWLHDEVCCNADSEWVADFPHDHCKDCRHFEGERG